MDNINENILLEKIRNLETKYEETVSLLNSTLDSIMEGILVVDILGKIVFFNKTFLDIWSIPEEIINERDDDKTLGFVIGQLKNADSFMDKVNQLYSKPKAVSHDILQFKDGRIIERFSKPQTISGDIIGRVWSFFDITDKIITDETLIKEKDMLQALLNNIPDTIYFKDKDSKFTRINKAHSKILGISDPKDAVGKSDFDFFELDHAKAAFDDEQSIIKSKRPLISKPEKIKLSDNKFRWVTSTKVPIMNVQNECIGLVGISRDITSAKIAEEKLERYSEELKELNASKDKLFSIIAHDLRGPFSPLLGLSEIMVNESNTLSREDIRDYSNEIYKALKNEFTLLENLLNWSRLETGNMKYSPEKINLNEKAESVIGLLLGNAKLKGVSLSNEIGKDVFVSADPTMLHSILQNLIANSIKFTNIGDKIKISLGKDKKDFVRVTVSDTGVGMQIDQAKNLFGIAATSTIGTNNEKGTGLGLMICKEMVERHGGTISVKSEAGIGTDISFTLPRVL